MIYAWFRIRSHGCWHYVRWAVGHAQSSINQLTGSKRSFLKFIKHIVLEDVSKAGWQNCQKVLSSNKSCISTLHVAVSCFSEWIVRNCNNNSCSSSAMKNLECRQQSWLITYLSHIRHSPPTFIFKITTNAVWYQWF